MKSSRSLYPGEVIRLRESIRSKVSLLDSYIDQSLSAISTNAFILEERQVSEIVSLCSSLDKLSIPLESFPDEPSREKTSGGNSNNSHATLEKQKEDDNIMVDDFAACVALDEGGTTLMRLLDPSKPFFKYPKIVEEAIVVLRKLHSLAIKFHDESPNNIQQILEKIWNKTTIINILCLLKLAGDHFAFSRIELSTSSLRGERILWRIGDLIRFICLPMNFEEYYEIFTLGRYSNVLFRIFGECSCEFCAISKQALAYWREDFSMNISRRNRMHAAGGFALIVEYYFRLENGRFDYLEGTKTLDNSLPSTMTASQLDQVSKRKKSKSKPKSNGTTSKELNWQSPFMLPMDIVCLLIVEKNMRDEFSKANGVQQVVGLLKRELLLENPDAALIEGMLSIIAVSEVESVVLSHLFKEESCLFENLLRILLARELSSKSTRGRRHVDFAMSTFVCMNLLLFNARSETELCKFFLERNDRGKNAFDCILKFLRSFPHSGMNAIVIGMLRRLSNDQECARYLLANHAIEILLKGLEPKEVSEYGCLLAIGEAIELLTRLSSIELIGYDGIRRSPWKLQYQRHWEEIKPNLEKISTSIRKKVSLFSKGLKRPVGTSIPLEVTDESLMSANKECEACGISDRSTKLFACQRCSAVYYCNKEHQTQHWTYHKWNCKPKRFWDIPKVPIVILLFLLGLLWWKIRDSVSFAIW